MLQYPAEITKLTCEIGELQRSHAGVANFAPPQQELRKTHSREGVPWLRLYAVDFPEDDLAVYFAELKALLTKYPPFKFVEELEFKQLLPIISHYLEGDSGPVGGIAAAMEANPASLQFFLQELLRPSFKSWAVFFRDYLSQDDWRLNICPVCGNHPAGGRQDTKEGHRFLVCSQCETEWLFNRVTCTSCYNDDHKTLGYFTVEEVDDWRISFCRQCGSYIKEAVTDGPVSALDFELAVQLDILAKREGFHPIKL